MDEDGLYFDPELDDTDLIEDEGGPDWDQLAWAEIEYSTVDPSSEDYPWWSGNRSDW